MNIHIPKIHQKNISSPCIVAHLFNIILNTECEIDQDKEHFWVLGLNVKNQIQYIELVSLGTLSDNLVHPREVFRYAIQKAIYAIILVHNHPSGDTTPSGTDRETTKKLREAGKILGIPVLDHIIIGNGASSDNFYSFKEKGV